MAKRNRPKSPKSWLDKKLAWMEHWLGEEHDQVCQSAVPFDQGGGLDLHYYPNTWEGTGIATQTLSRGPDRGPSNVAFKNYELLMVTPESLDLDAAFDLESDFGRAHHSIMVTLECIARFSLETTLNPGETCEFPSSLGVIGGHCLIFDGIGVQAEQIEFGVLLLIDIHPDEMTFALEHGGGELLDRLRKAGHYPYSDRKRKSVV
jgi:hypothetical protein